MGRLLFIAIALVLIAFAIVSPASAQQPHLYVTGNQLLLACVEVERGKDSGDIYKAMECVHFVRGAMDAHVLWHEVESRPRPYCAPGSASPGQRGLVVLKWLRDHPESLHLPASFSVLKAMAQAFPC
jgi:hypothetical protein